MPSILQEQLKKVSTTWGAPTGKRQRGKPSLLYTASEAADVDLQSLYELAQEGFEQLCSVDTRFEPFQTTLFSQAGLELNRNERTKADNESLDASLGAYLRLLTDHFLSEVSFQTLEYLIRRYRVNEFNVDSLLACGLPYHATNHFVRLVQILHLDHTCWNFLSPMQKSGAAMPRALLVQRCINDQAVLRAICEAAKAVSTGRTASSSMQSFYAVLLCELLLTTQPIKEDLVRLLLPYLMAGLAVSVIADYRAATLMILTQLASQATLSDTLLAGVVQEMLRNTPDTQMGQAVMVLCHLALTQAQLTQLPKAVFKSVMKIPGLVGHLRSLSDKGMAVGPLLSLLLPRLGSSILDKKLYLKTALLLVKELPLGMHAQPFATSILTQLPQASAEQQGLLTPLIRALDLTFPDHMDAAVNQLLQHSKGSEQAAAQGVAHLLQTALAGSARAPLTAAGSTLALAVDSPSTEMRIQALKQLDTAQQADTTAAGKVGLEQSAFLQDALLRRLADDEPTVVTTVLSLPSLDALPGATLYPALAALVTKSVQVLRIAGRKSEHKVWQNVARKALRLLSEDFVSKHPSLKQQVVLLLLNHSIVLGRNRKVAVEAISVLQGHNDILLSGLAAVNLADEDSDNVKSPDSNTADGIAPTTPNRTTAKAADLTLNQAVVHALAEQLASDKASDASKALTHAQDLIQAADSFPHTRHLLLLALMQACHLSSKPSAVGEALVRATHALWPAVAASAALTGPTPAAVADGQGAPTAAHLKQWEKKGSRSYAAVLQQALLMGLQHFPPEALQSLPGRLAPHPFLMALLQLAPHAVFHAHCCAFLEKTADAAKLLSDIFGAAGDTTQQAVQELALRLLQPQLTSSTSESVQIVLFPRVLAAAASSSLEVRTQALDCLVQASTDAAVAGRLVSSDRLPAGPLQAFLAAVAEHHAEILSDGLGLMQVVKRLLPAINHKSNATGRGHAGKAGSGQLDAKVSAAVIHYMLEVLPHLHDNSSVLAASVLCHILSGSAAPAQLLHSALATLHQLPFVSESGGKPSESQIQLACDLLQLFTVEAFQALPAPKVTAKAAKAASCPSTEGFEVLLQFARAGIKGHLVDSQEMTKLRVAAFERLGADLYAVMPVQQQLQAFLELLNGSSRDPSEQVRTAARSALAQLPLTALSLLPLLTVLDKAAATDVDTPAPKTRKRSKAESNVKHAAEELNVLQLAGEATGMELCTSVLELLQWKDDIQDKAELLAPLCKVLQQLLSTTAPADMGAAASPALQSAMDTSDDDGDSGDEDGADAAAVPTSRSTHKGYAMALVLQAVQNIADQAPVAWLSAVDVALVLKCAREAPDSAVRNAALALLEVLAKKLPDSTLQHVLEVVGIVGSSASQQDDTHSHQVAAATLAAVVPAWLQAGKPLPDLAAAVIAPLPNLLPHRRLPLLSALIAVVPQDAARPVVLSLLLQKALQLSSAGMDSVSAQPFAKREDSWPVVLANSVCHQASLLQRTQALTVLLEHAVAQSEQQPQQPLPALAVTFATTQVQESAAGVSASRSSDEVQAAYSALLEQALSHLQLLGVESASAKHSKKKAQERLYALLEALAKVMQGGLYMAALLRLTAHPSEAVIRRALKLLTTSLANISQQDAQVRIQASVAEAADGPGRGTAEAALELCDLAPALLQTGEGSRQLGASTRQAVLIAVSAVGATLGATHPKPFVSVLPALVAAAQDVHRSVRSSALAAAASCLAALGSAALPLLPKLVPAVLAAAQMAVDGLATSSSEDNEAEAEEESSSEGAALEAAAALAAVSALVEGLKAFLSPHLSALLNLLFSPPVLACKQAGCSESAGSIRIQLAGVMPPRLLLAPLFAHFEGAVKEGEAATVSLLAMAQRTIEQMDPSTAAQHADVCFTFLLKALDLRQRRPAHLPSLDTVEQGAVAVLLALTMKLSEAKFKPLFLRLLDWATTPPAAQPDAKPVGRQVALFTAVLGLTDRLRSVFVPYFRYLLDPIAAHLGGGEQEGEGPKRKKKRKASSGMLAVADEASTEPGAVEDTWRLRHKVVQALHSCFLYDTVSFLDEARFHRLLPLLVSQLAAQPPAAVSALFAAQPESSAAPALAADAFGDAVVSALVQMAVTANNDALWKSLNHQTLMATRSPAVEERLRAVAAVEGLVGRMREEYLLLLPETLPFVAELLEDPEHQVAVVTQRLIKTLEELSGESLDQYLQP